MEQEKQLTSLPENAYRELKPGEEYTPIMPASSSPREVTPYSVTMGIVMAVMMAVMMPKLWYLWMSVGWGMGFAIGTSLRSSEASKPSEVAVSE